jgi:hypothetical protein
VGALCLAAPLPVARLLALRPAALTPLEQLGLAPACYAAPLPAAAPLLLVAALFAGPLLEAALLGAAAARRGKGCGSALAAALPHMAALSPLRAARALLAAPVLEEWVFRALAAPLWRAAGAGHGATLAATCTCFAAVHAHHYWELVRGGLPPAAAARAVALQVAYTAAFAAIAAHAFQRSGSLAGVVAAHALANALGLPSVAWLQEGHPLHAARAALGAALVGGVAGFAWLLASGSGSGLWAGARCALFPAGTAAAAAAAAL